MRSPRGWRLACVLLLVGCNCALVTSRRKALKEAVEDFSRSVRWNDWEGSRVYYAAQEQLDLGTSEDTSEIRITDLSLGGVAPQEDDTAVISVVVEWYRPSQGTVHRSWLRQVWRDRGGAWRIERQRTYKGPSLPLLPTIDPSEDAPHGQGRAASKRGRPPRS